MKPEYFVYLSFLVFLAILYRAGVFKMLVDFLDESRLKIEKDAQDALDAFKKSETVYAEYKERMESLEKKADEVLENARANISEMHKTSLKEIEALRVRYSETEGKKTNELEKNARRACLDYAAGQLNLDLKSALKSGKSASESVSNGRYLKLLEKSLDKSEIE